jgi:RimJ/RimL family protein N-acetyltransferase
MPDIRLIPLTTDDEATVVALLRQPQVRRFLTDDVPIPHEAVRAMIAESLDRSATATYWRVTTTAGEMVGIAGLRPPMAAMLGLRAIGWRSLELVVAIDPAQWGRGFARAAIETMATVAGADGVTFVLVAGVDQPNTRSHRLMQRAGFHVLGHVDGPAHPITVYERAV